MLLDFSLSQVQSFILNVQAVDTMDKLLEDLGWSMWSLN